MKQVADWIAARHTCTKQNPWHKGMNCPAHHPDAVHVGTCKDGCCDELYCPHCGTVFMVEVAQ